MIYFILALYLLSTSQPDTTERLLGALYFDATGTVLTSQSEAILRIVADMLHTERNLMIDVYGHACNMTSPSANITLSQHMADKVREFLTVNLEIAGDRIAPIGLGSKNRIVSTKGKLDETKKPEVEIVIRKPDAVLTWFQNDVKVQPPALRPDWLEPAPNYYLYRGYKVATGKKSSAQILYPNKGTLTVEEEAVVIINGLNLDRKEQSTINNIESQNGSLTAILRDAASQEDSTMNQPDSVNELKPMNSTASVDAKLENLVIAYQSNGNSVTSEITLTDTGDVAAGTQDTNTRPPAGYGLGIIIGEPTGIGCKSWIARNHAIDLEIGWSFPGERIHVAADYISHFPQWIQRSGWYPYLGIGGRLRMNIDQGEGQFRLGIRFGVGAEYIYRQFGFFTEFYPVVDLVPETVLGLECGIGARYYFRE